MWAWIKEHSLSIFLIALTISQTYTTWVLLRPYLKTDKEFWGEWLMSVVADSYGAALLVLAGIIFRERSSSQDS